MTVTLDVGHIVQAVVVALLLWGLRKQSKNNEDVARTQSETAKILVGLKQQIDDHEKHCQFAWQAHEKNHAEIKETNLERFEGIWRKLEASK